MCSDLVTGIEQFLRQTFVVGEQPGGHVPQRDNAGPRQCGDVHHTLGIEALDVSEGIAEYQASLGIGVEDLHGLTRHRRDHVPRFCGSAAGHVLRGGNDADDVERQFHQRWNDWVAQREAIAMPGAVAFLKQADADGGTVFYITNRKEPEKRETCNNLTQVGLPLKDCATQVLTRNLMEANSKDQGARRKIVAAKYRVVLVLGDNLGDFTDGVYTTTEVRAQLVEDHAGWWGERWIILPNPMYGSWEDAISNVQKDAVNHTFGAELERRRLLKGRSLRGVDWWANPPTIEEKAK